MPEIKHYEIEQTRRVTVTANDEAQALAVATEHWDRGEIVHAQGYVSRDAGVVNIDLRRLG